MPTIEDKLYDMAELAFEKNATYELVDFMCWYCEEQLGKSWEETLELVRRTLL